jgi:outer membrane lipoprotein SlyB
MTTDLVLMGAALLSGLLLGCLLTHSYTSSVISLSQERMQRKVRYWQGEAIRARAAADQIARQISTPDL